MKHTPIILNSQIVLIPPLGSNLQIMFRSHLSKNLLQQLLVLVGVQLVDPLGERSEGIHALQSRDEIGSYNGVDAG
jgi:hypothetical protein